MKRIEEILNIAIATFGALDSRPHNADIAAIIKSGRKIPI